MVDFPAYLEKGASKRFRYGYAIHRFFAGVLMADYFDISAIDFEKQYVFKIGGENMAIRDYWIYQQRDVRCPWALYVVKKYDRRKPDSTYIDYTLYHEDIENQTHSISKVGLHFNLISDYVNDVISSIIDNTMQTVHHDDFRQLEIELYHILQD